MKANDESELSLSSVNKDCFSTHIFEETQFMGVTAYQNQQVGRREGGRDGSGVGVCRQHCGTGIMAQKRREESVALFKPTTMLASSM